MERGGRQPAESTFPFLYDPWVRSREGGFVELPEPEPQGTSVADITNDGVILGSMRDAQRTVLFTPINDAAGVLDDLEDTLDGILDARPGTS